MKRLAVALCLMLPHLGEAALPSEYEVKAAFIHNIAKFVDWPAELPVSGRAKLCLLGRNPFGQALDELQDKQIGSLHWEIVPLGSGGNPKDCRVLFIAASERDNLGRILQSIGNSPVLTMGDTEGYARQGVMVNFYLEQSRVRFEVNRDAVKRAGLEISSQLLKLARIVPGGAR